MNEEMFDIVNEHNEVIGRRPRSEVHRLGLKHRAVHVLVFNKQGAVFLQKRSAVKDTFPGAWDSSASGHLDTGEDYADAALRELGEELGWRPAHPLERLFSLGACADTGQEFVRVYRCRGEGPFALHPSEIECGGWFSTDTVDRWLENTPQEFASAFRLIWKIIRSSSV